MKVEWKFFKNHENSRYRSKDCWAFPISRLIMRLETFWPPVSFAVLTNVLRFPETRHSWRASASLLRKVGVFYKIIIIKYCEHLKEKCYVNIQSWGLQLTCKPLSIWLHLFFSFKYKKVTFNLFSVAENVFFKKI